MCGIIGVIMTSDQKYKITYSDEALRTLDEMTEQYGFENREKTLEFALFAIKRLRENGNIALKSEYGG